MNPLEITKLRLLHSIRKDMFNYNNPEGDKEPDETKKNLIDEYLALMEKDAVQSCQKFLQELKEKVLQTSFDLRKWYQLSLSDEKASEAETQAIKDKNNKIRKNNDKIQEANDIKLKVIHELIFERKLKSKSDELKTTINRLRNDTVEITQIIINLDRSPETEDIDLLSITSIKKEDDKNLSVTFADGHKETIKIKGNVSGGLGAIGNTGLSNQKKEQLQGKYLSVKDVNCISKNGTISFTAKKQATISQKSTRKKSVDKDLKKELNDEEHEIYCRLSEENGEKFLAEIQMRNAYTHNVRNVFAGLPQDEKDLRKLIANKTELHKKLSKALAVTSKTKICKDDINIIPSADALEKIVDEALTRLIEEDIKGENGKKHIWSQFSKTPDKPRYSQYEIYLSNAARSFKYDDLFNSRTKEEMKKEIKKALETIQEQSGTLKLPESLAPEILCLGVFNAGIKRAQNEGDLAKMNAILREFGINIRFETRKITNVPSQEESRDYLKDQRDNFRREDGHNGHKTIKEGFEKLEKTDFGKRLSKKEVHHFIPLRYNGFIDEELNKGSNYVAVALEHEYNLDLHALVHTYDTPEETLVLNQDGTISSMQYSYMRKKGSGTLLIPILQLKRDKEFEDVLPRSKENKISTKISDDKTPVCYTLIPDLIPDKEISRTYSRYGKDNER